MTVDQDPLIQADFIKRRARMLPTAARYETLLNLPSGADLGGGSLVAGLINAQFAPILGSSTGRVERWRNSRRFGLSVSVPFV